MVIFKQVKPFSGIFYENIATLSYFCHRLSQKWINISGKNIDF